MKSPKSSLILIGLALILFAAGIITKVVQDQQAAANKPHEVKETTIPMKVEDFQDDPHLQAAVEQQLQQQQGSVQSTARQGSDTSTAQLLQPVPAGLPENQ